MNILKSMLLFAAFFTFAACTDDETPTPLVVESLPIEIEGSWIIATITGGFTGQGYTPDFTHLRVSGTGYELLDGDAVVAEGVLKVEVITDNLITLNFETDATPPRPIEAEEKSVELRDDNLILRDHLLSDGYMYTFKKQ